MVFGLIIIFSLVGLIIGLTLGLRINALPDGGSPVDPPLIRYSPMEKYKSGATTTQTINCSTIGKNILRDGGSATDAAISATICLTAICPHSSGIGGGNFMVIYDRNRSSSGNNSKPTFRSIIAREQAPQSAHKNMFVNNTLSSEKGGLSIAVPGEIHGLYTAWLEFGVLDWAKLIQPTIDLFEKGVVIEKYLANVIKIKENSIRNNDGLRQLFIKNNETLKDGDVYKNDNLKKSLELIRDDPMSFYNGSLARDIVADINDSGGNFTLSDLSSYQARRESPLSIALKNENLIKLYSAGPPSSGLILLSIFNVLDKFQMSPKNLSTVNATILAYHRMVETFKFAYGKRSSLGDSKFVNVTELIGNLTSDQYGDYIKSRISDERTFNSTYYEADFQIEEDHGTAHTSVVKGDTAVSVTSTINLFFGSEVVGKRTGIIFNDEMDDFSTPGKNNYFGVPASPSNFIEPGKIPMSSMSPVIFLDDQDRVIYVSGGAGGTKITTAVAWAAAHNLWFGKEVNEALDMPRLHHQLIPHEIAVEPFFDTNIIKGLRGKGHVINQQNNRFAVVQSIHKKCHDDNDLCIHASSDGRAPSSMPDGY